MRGRCTSIVNISRSISACTKYCCARPLLSVHAAAQNLKNGSCADDRGGAPRLLALSGGLDGGLERDRPEADRCDVEEE